MTRPTTIGAAAALAAAVIIICYQLGRGDRPTTAQPAESAATSTTAGPPHRTGTAVTPQGDGALDEPQPIDVGDQPDGSAAYGETAQARAQWEPVLNGFGHAFARPNKPEDAAAWRASLRPYVTAALGTELAHTDPDKIPNGRYQGWRIIDAGITQITVEIHYDPGRSVIVDLVTDGQHWLLTHIRPT
jgi:hypothetical protein